jgi:DNA-binding beta-propeller fold protein YncE
MAALACTLLALFSPLLIPIAHADGGAPNLAYVSGAAKGISIIDVAQQKITGTLPVTGNPQAIQLSLDARFLYVTEPQAGQLAILAARTGQTVCTAKIPGQPSLMAIDKSTGTIYVAGNESSVVSAVNPNNCAITQTFHTKGPVYGLAVAVVASSLSNTSGNQLWVATSDELTVFDTLKGSIINRVPVAGGPQYVSIPPGATVYATTRNGSVVAVDLNSLKVIPLIHGSQYGPMDFDETTGEVYVPDVLHNRLDVLAPVNAGSPPPHEPSRTIDLSTQPRSVAITSDGQLGFIALANGNVAMLDVPGRQITNTFSVGGAPTFIITGMYPPVVGTTPQQANIWGTIINVAAYIFVIALLVVPVLLYRRYTRANRKDTEEALSEDEAKALSTEDVNEVHEKSPQADRKVKD